MIRIDVKVVPGARQNRIVGMLGSAIKVQVAAAPEKGRANEAVLELLAEFLGVPRQRISVVSGHTSPRKVVAVEGLTQDDIAAKLAGLG